MLLSPESDRQYAFTAAAREDRTREGWHEQNAGGEDSNNNQGLNTVNEVKVLGDALWQGREVLEDEPLENHQERECHDRHERVLNERLEPGPEQPVQFRNDEERDEDRPEQRTHGAGDQTECHDSQ